jgi:hydrogenase maturation protein HypF
LGLAWDGAGYGPDRTLWGGEALWCQGAEYRRVAHLRTFPLPGAERALREPRRALLGALHVTGLWTHAAALTDFDAAELSILERALERRLQAPSPSSMGRLFDAVAALLGLRGVCDFEGQAADELMQVASRATAAAGAYPFTFDAQGVVDWQPMLHELVDERARGVKVETLARRFHETLVQIGAEIAQRYSNGTLVLSGGCFQNPLLLGRMLEVLPQRGIRPLTSWAVPVNDGGLAVGQAWVAAQH